MTQLVFGQDEAVANWVGEGLKIRMVPPYVAIGGTVDGKSLCIGVVFNNWNGANLNISLYGPRALRRGALRAIYHYAFVQAGAVRLTAITRRSNVAMQRMLPKLGFEFEGESKRYFGDEDALRYVLFREAAEKWMV